MSDDAGRPCYGACPCHQRGIPCDDCLPDPRVWNDMATIDERALDEAFRVHNESFALFGSLHGRAVEIPPAQMRDILRGAIQTYVGNRAGPTS